MAISKNASLSRRRKPPKLSTEKEAYSNSGTDEDPMKGLAGEKNTSNPYKLDKMSLQELEVRDVRNARVLFILL